MKWIALAALTALTLPLQSGPPTITADATTGHRPVLRLGGLLDDRDLEEAARSGLPLRIRVRVELWRDRLFDELRATESWTAVIIYEPRERQFQVRWRGAPADRRYPNYRSARAALEGSYALAIRPSRSGTFYYTGNIEIETLSLSDLGELERWLEGELGPAVAGDKSVPGAVGEGAKRVLIRILGMPARKTEIRSEKFRIP